MMIIEDGSLPSNVGGGSNVRNILRRVFAILQKHSWWDKIGGLEGLIQIFKHQRVRAVISQQKLHSSFDQLL